ncbi:MAG: small multi-drug export protein [Methanobacterium sp. ERen5]|nr:MAG: small multi-drug export protein [Methanobacterium sp. ERen5]
MNIFVSILFVFLASVLELWLSIPLGLVLKLNPILIIVAAAAGSIVSAFLVVTLGEGVRKWFIKWRYGSGSIEHGRIYNIWNKYGIIGLGLLSPLLFGAPLGAAIGVGLGASKNRLLLWMSIGIVIWSVVLTLVAFYGWLNIESFTNK